MRRGRLPTGPWQAAGATLGALLAAAALADGEPRFADGAATFQANCAVCHRVNGAGTPGLAPPVTEYPARFLATPEGRRQLALTVLFGMYGEIVVGERHYNFKMPEFTRLDDATLAAALNFVAFDLGHAPADAAPLAAAEIAALRTQAIDGSAVREHRAEVVSKLAP
jgi:mono/diheme cytochrome c family protein